ncbi:TIGR01457 family HAD-type hydrolase [Alkalicoccus luteus]|uniref:TIGR01457 family HAD-type hydrolase n=1 Tax=Alkalicoccus luteus TaxID=1237094 RepID=A0A969PRY9_9BACI|nr:TIGR01457 family HAD-type hydrolase [Alkalicoccus luteus]NJP38278.1 TIGR01457 family HAD-type hydrolase [Alkalicoccus luteus]
MKQFTGYLLDLDGTMYRGTERIDAGKRLVDRLADAGIPYLFVTNNSSKTPEQIAEKLQEMEIKAEPSQVMTSAEACASYLKRKHGELNVYAIGEHGLLTALESEGHTRVSEKADAVVMGIDRQLTYEKLADACLQVRNGAKFVSTNADKAVPTERGMLPGNGSLTSVVHVSTGVEPLFIGKPEAIIMEEAMKRLGTDPSLTVMVGDNYETDIMAGMRAGIATLLVFSGFTRPEDRAWQVKRPDFTVTTLDDWSV